MLLAKRLILWLALVSVFVIPQAAPAAVVNRVIAEVGSEVITSADLEKMISYMEASLRPAPTPQAADQRRKELARIALDRLIEDKILAQEVERQKVKVSEQAVEGYIERMKKSNNISDEMFAAQLRRRGLTPQEYREQLKKDMLKHRLIRDQVRSQVVISDEQVNDYYKKHHDQFQNMNQVTLRALFVRVPEDASPAAEEALKQKTEKLRAQALAKGNFAELAQKHSEGPGARNGGELGPLAVSDLLPAMRMALSELKPGQISPVLKVPGSFVFMQLLESSGKSGTPLQQVKEQIRAKLENDAAEKKFRDWLDELRSKTYVRIVK